MLFILCGPGGVGKGTVASRLIDTVDHLKLSRSWTTRQQRPGEPSDAYVFASDVEFKSKTEEGFFIEWATFLDNSYGTPWPCQDVLGCDRHLLLEIDVQGARQIKEKFADSVIIVLSPPSQQELIRRLEARGDNHDHIKARVKLAQQEIGAAKALGGTEFVNLDLTETVARVGHFIKRCIDDCASTVV